MDVNEIFLDCKDDINPDERGYFTELEFGRYSWVAQLRVLDWLSGDVAGAQVPEAFNTQKNRDWLSDFFVKKEDNVTAGVIKKPDDYYRFETLYTIKGSYDSGEDVDTENQVIVPDATITLMDNSKFNERIATYIEGDKPTLKNPIAKMLGKTFEFYPKDLGSVALEYVRYPKRAVLKTKMDEEYNEPIYDKEGSTQFEWNEYARPLLVWFIVNSFYNRTRDTAGKQMNQATPKLSRQ